MHPTDPIIYTANMTEQQRTWFFAEYQHARRDEVLGVLFAIFLGGFGVHHFYLRRYGLGFLYLCFFWTGIPAVLGWIDAFFTPARVRRYNAEQAAYIASQILGSTASYTVPRCPACSKPVEQTAIFCPYCGAAIATGSHYSTQSAT